MAYSAEQKAAALYRLALNSNDYKVTAAETNISEKQLRRWSHGQNVSTGTKSPEKVPTAQPVLTVADLLEGAVKRLLEMTPSNMNGAQWATAIGILMDKWLILQDLPNQRVETITRMLEQLPDDEYNAILKEAEAILAATRGSTDRGGSEAARIDGNDAD